jgi:lantibiotic transport system permease protein
MKSLSRAVFAECLKLRGTLALWMCLIAPTVIVALLVLQISFSRAPVKPQGDGIESWMAFAQGCLALWSFLMLPLFVTLESALLAGLDHAENHWKHLLALPLPRYTHYLAKWLILVALLLMSSALIAFLLIPIGGALLMLWQPNYGIAGLPPVFKIAKITSLIFAAAMLMMAIQHWIAIRFRNFTVAVASGMSATVMGFLIGQSERFGPWFPWTMAIQPLTKFGHLGILISASVVIAIIVTAMGAYGFSRRAAA